MSTTPDPQPITAAIAVTVLAGIDSAATSTLASGLLLRSERCASIWVDPTTAGDGYMRWRVDDSDGRHATGRFVMTDRCAPCALRATVIQLLDKLRGAGTCDTVVLELHPTVEVDAAVTGLCAGLPKELARIDTIVAVLDTSSWLDELAGDVDLRVRGIAADEHDDRTVGTLIAAQLDLADRIVLVSPAGATEPVPGEQWTALVYALVLRVAGQSWWTARGLSVQFAQVVRLGHDIDTTWEVQRLLGRPARTIDDYLADNLDTFRRSR